MIHRTAGNVNRSLGRNGCHDRCLVIPGGRCTGRLLDIVDMQKEAGVAGMIRFGRHAGTQLSGRVIGPILGSRQSPAGGDRLGKPQPNIAAKTGLSRVRERLLRFEHHHRSRDSLRSDIKHLTVETLVAGGVIVLDFSEICLAANRHSRWYMDAECLTIGSGLSGREPA